MTAVLNFITPNWSLQGFYNGFHNLFCSMGKARAAGELARMGYHDQAKAIMLDNSMMR